ncbi:solute carrier family 35 member G1-like [Clytia hemisphaerica]|uniref:solute carrier family 35 member G1-like n=1 Tax=Clytia hemisphaerica TaxID=252671 RepID=UPI0034D611F0
MADNEANNSESKEEEELIGGLTKGRRRVYGLCLMSLAGFYVVLANTLVQLIHEHSITDISSLTILFSRSVVTVAMALMFMLFARIHPFPSKRETLALSALGLTGVGAILFMYLALSLIPVGDVTVIHFTAPIFTSAMGGIFLKQPCSFMDAFLGFISFCGVFIMTKPTIIFGKQDHQSETICESVTGCENQVDSVDPNHNDTYIYGVGYTLIAAFLVSVFFILNKLISRKTDVILTLFYTGTMGLILPSIIMCITQKPFQIGAQWEIWLLLGLIGVLSVVHLFFVAESLQFEDAGPAALIRNADCVYAFVLQFLVLGVTPNLLTIIGALIVVVSSTTMGVTRYLSAKRAK